MKYMSQIPNISNSFMESHTDFKELIQLINQGFAKKRITTPMRHHHDYPNPKEGIDSTLLLMPSWQEGKDIGVKMVSVNPNNGRYHLPSIQGVYIYSDGHKGTVKAILDAKSLTAKRTAATSALAASYLARNNSSSLLIIGTGVLAPNLIKAHTSIRPIKKVFLWGRDVKKAEHIARSFSDEPYKVQAVENYIEYMSEVDIISCATLSASPLIFGDHLKPGQHIDLVGSYKKDTREADDETISKSVIFLDTYEGGLKESGDIVIPLQTGILKKSDIRSDLFELCSEIESGRKTEDEITLFKSVGHASEDLIGARYYYEKFQKSINK